MFEGVYRNINQPSFNAEVFHKKNPQIQLQHITKMLKDPEFASALSPQGLENLRAVSKVLESDSKTISKLFHKVVFGVEKSIDRCEKVKFFALLDEKKFDEVELILPIVLKNFSRDEKRKFLSSLTEPGLLSALPDKPLQAILRAAYREGLLFHVLESEPTLVHDDTFQKLLKEVLTTELVRSSKNHNPFSKGFYSTIIINVGKNPKKSDFDVREAVSECLAEAYLEVVSKHHNQESIHDDMKYLVTEAIVWRLLLGTAPALELPLADKGCSLKVLKAKMLILANRLMKEEVNGSWIEKHVHRIHAVLANNPSLMDRIAVKVWLSYERYYEAATIDQ